MYLEHGRRLRRAVAHRVGRHRPRRPIRAECILASLEIDGKCILRGAAGQIEHSTVPASSHVLVPSLCGCAIEHHPGQFRAHERSQHTPSPVVCQAAARRRAAAASAPRRRLPSQRHPSQRHCHRTEALLPASRSRQWHCRPRHVRHRRLQPPEKLHVWPAPGSARSRRHCCGRACILAAGGRC